MKLRYLGQGGFVIETAGKRIAIDPYLSDSVNRTEGRPRLLPIPVKPADLGCCAVICTHDHQDHLDEDTVVRMDPDQYFITTEEGKKHLVSIGRRNVTALHIGDSLKLGEVAVHAVFAIHTAEAFGVVLESEGMAIYFSGDTLFDERLFDVRQFDPDAVIICINGRLGNMNVKEAVRTAETIGAPLNIPEHYDMFASNSEDPRLFADFVRGGTVLEFNRVYDVKELIDRARSV